MDISAKPDLRLVVGGTAPDATFDYPWEGALDAGLPVDPGGYAWEEPIWLHPFVPGKPLAENCFSMARPLFGKPRAEWALMLGNELTERRPEANRGKQKRGWTAAVLLAAAIDHGLRADVARWREVVHDVTELSGVREQTAVRRLKQLLREGMARPTNPPRYWLDIEPGARGGGLPGPGRLMINQN